MFGSFYVEITDACNLRCRHCFNSSGEQKNVFVDDNYLEHLISSIEFCEPKTISISGGEAFLHPQFVDIIKKIKKHCTDVWVVTNLTVIDKKIISFLETNNISLQVSIDGLKENHDKIRGIGGFDKVIRNIQMISDCYNLDRMCVKGVLTKALYNDFEKYIHEIYSYGINHFSFGFLSATGRAKDQFYHENKLDSKEIIELEKKARKLILQNDNIQIDFPKVCFSCGLLSNESKEINIRIDSYGNIFPCQGLVEQSHIIGNIFDMSVADAVNGERYQRLLDRLHKRQERYSECERCFLGKRFCKRGCPADDINLHGDLCKVDDMCDLRIYTFLHNLKLNNKR